MCPLPSHKSSGPMGSKSKSVLMTVAPWDPEALAAFDGPDMVTGPRGKAGHSWPEKDRNSLCALPNLSDSRDRENPLRLLSGDNGWRPPCTQQQLQTLGPWPEAPGDVPPWLSALPSPLSNTAGSAYVLSLTLLRYLFVMKLLGFSLSFWK